MEESTPKGQNWSQAFAQAIRSRPHQSYDQYVEGSKVEVDPSYIKAAKLHRCAARFVRTQPQRNQLIRRPFPRNTSSTILWELICWQSVTSMARKIV